MTKTVPPRRGPAVPRIFPDLESQSELLRIPPQSTADCLARIEILGQRVAEYVEFMGGVDAWAGASPEAKERAVMDFHECLADLARDLGRIVQPLPRRKVAAARARSAKMK